MEKIATFGCWILMPLFILYIFSMFVFPWFDGDFEWTYVQNVWYDWQAFNVGILAFSASVIAFYISRYNAEQQRKREFTSSQAFLPHALSELCEYLRLSSKIVADSCARTSDNNREHEESKIEVPKLPASHAEIFKECIKHAKPDVGNHLANILKLLQIHHTRMKEMPDSTALNYPYCKSCMYRLGELQFLVNSLFEFARNESEFTVPERTWESFNSAYRGLGIEVDNFEDLEDFTKRKIKSKHITS